MDHVLAIVFGFVLAVLVLSPFVPGLRPIARTLMVGGLAVFTTIFTAVAAAGSHWRELLAEARAEHAAKALPPSHTVEVETSVVARRDGE